MLIFWVRLALTLPQRSVTGILRTTTIGQVPDGAPSVCWTLSGWLGVQASLMVAPCCHKPEMSRAAGKAPMAQPFNVNGGKCPVKR